MSEVVGLFSYIENNTGVIWKTYFWELKKISQ